MRAVIKFWKANKGFIVFILLMFVFRSSVADWNTVPTGSMKPTILEGDRILVNKLAYDVQLPFLHKSILTLAEPQAGEIVVFLSAVTGNRMVKRVVGTPGDTVALVDNVLYVNGERAAYQTQSVEGALADRLESLGHRERVVRVHGAGSTLDTFGPVQVPEDRYLVLGDNRDNSADSRVIGFIPRNEIIGRSQRVVVSLNPENFYLPRSQRFWHRL